MKTFLRVAVYTCGAAALALLAAYVCSRTVRDAFVYYFEPESLKHAVIQLTPDLPTKIFSAKVFDASNNPTQGVTYRFAFPPGQVSVKGISNSVAVVSSLDAAERSEMMILVFFQPKGKTLAAVWSDFYTKEIARNFTEAPQPTTAPVSPQGAQVLGFAGKGNLWTIAQFEQYPGWYVVFSSKAGQPDDFRTVANSFSFI